MNNTTQQHTPATWAVVHYPDSKNSVIQSDSYQIAKVFNTHAETEDLRIEQLANAQLIVSAPELLEALKAVKDYLDTPHTIKLEKTNRLRSVIKSAIAKAEGK